MNKGPENLLINLPGISISHSRTSEAFMLIVFMVGDLLVVYKTISIKDKAHILPGPGTEQYTSLKNKILKNLSSQETTNLNLEESICLYLLVDIVCKCFVDDNNETLKQLAIQNVDISEEEYDILRINFLRYGQSLIEKMNEWFEKNKLFRDGIERLKG